MTEPRDHHEDRADKAGAGYRPSGREAVVKALVDAAARLVVERGMSVSVRDIATEANVNHGLVHQYFGSKKTLLAAGLRSINERAALELRADGFPPADIAARRDGEFARAIARVMLDTPEDYGDLLTTHPVTVSWAAALRRTNPGISDFEVAERLASAGCLAFGWSVFAGAFTEIHKLSPEDAARLGASVSRRVREIGGIPSPEDPGQTAAPGHAPGEGAT